MADRRLRELERRAAAGDPQAELGLQAARLRAGRCPGCDGDFHTGHGPPPKPEGKMRAVVTNLHTPCADSDVATKSYVDSVSMGVLFAKPLPYKACLRGVRWPTLGEARIVQATCEMWCWCGEKDGWLQVETAVEPGSGLVLITGDGPALDDDNGITVDGGQPPADVC